MSFCTSGSKKSCLHNVVSAGGPWLVGGGSVGKNRGLAWVSGGVTIRSVVGPARRHTFWPSLHSERRAAFLFSFRGATIRANFWDFGSKNSSVAVKKLIFSSARIFLKISKNPSRLESDIFLTSLNCVNRFFLTTIGKKNQKTITL